MAYTGKFWTGSLPRSVRTFDELTRDMTNAIAFNTCKRAALVVKPVLLYGSTGTGKTTLMAAMYGSISTGLKCIWTSAEDLVADERAGWALARHYTDVRPEHNAREAAVAVAVLFIDDVGWERRAAPTVGDVLCARYDRNRPTFLSSNLDPDGIAARYGERVRSRLCETNVFIPVPGHDRRRVSA